MPSVSEKADTQYTAFNADAERAFAVTKVGIFAHSAKHIRACITRLHTLVQGRNLCTLATRLGINYCAEFFEKEKVDGEEMLLFKKEEFMSMLQTNTGDICTKSDYILHCTLIIIAYASVSRRCE